MNAATIFKTLTTVTLSITLLITGGCNNMEAKKEETGKNTAIENIFARKSVRTYTPQPIEKEKGKHSKKCTFYTLRFGCSFAAVNTIKPQLL